MFWSNNPISLLYLSLVLMPDLRRHTVFLPFSVPCHFFLIAGGNLGARDCCSQAFSNVDLRLGGGGNTSYDSVSVFQ